MVNLDSKQEDNFKLALDAINFGPAGFITLENILKNGDIDVNAVIDGTTLLYSEIAGLHHQNSTGVFPNVKLLVDHGADVKLPIGDGSTPLHAAVVTNNKELVRFLIEHGADVNAVDQDAQTPLHLASDRFAHSVVPELLQAKADPNIKDNQGRTPLHLHAVHAHTTASVNMFMSAGADCRLVDNEGRTALHIAAMRGNHETVYALLNSGAQQDVDDRYGNCPLSYAIGCYNHHSVREFLNAGVSVKRRHWVILAQHYSHPLTQQPDQSERKQLLSAMLHHDEDWQAIAIAKAVTKASADDYTGSSLLHVVCNYGSADEIRMLLDNPHVNADVWNRKSLSPLDLYLQRPGPVDPEVLASLIGRGAQIYQHDREHGVTLLKELYHLAVNDTSVRSVIEQHGVNFETVRNRGNTNLNIDTSHRSPHTAAKP